MVADVDGTTFRALRVTARPLNYGSLGAYALGMSSGTIAAALAANSELFQFRWPDATNLCIVYQCAVTAGANVAPAAATAYGLRMTVARSWTVAGSGGTRATLTGNNCKMRTSMGTSLVNDAGIATTAALTAGTKTLDTSDIGAVQSALGATTGEMLGSVMLLDADDGVVCPLILAQNEGFVVRSNTVLPAAMTWVLSVTTNWIEAAAY